jgi:hypothetical protein
MISLFQSTNPTEQLILNLTSKWPNISKKNEKSDENEPLKNFKCSKCTFETNRKNSLETHLENE